MKNIGYGQLVKMERSLESAKSRYQNAIAKSEETLQHVVQGAEAFASSFGFGVLQGRYASEGGVGIVGVPIELASGGALFLAAALGIGGKFAEHLYGFGTGALCAYGTTMGHGVGIKMAKAAGVHAAGEASLSKPELDALSAGAPSQS